MFKFWGNRSRVRANYDTVDWPASPDAQEDVTLSEGDAAIVGRLADEQGLSNRQLKKLSRVELLELMVEQAKRIDELKEQLERVENQALAQRVALQQIVTVSQASLGIDVDAQTAQEALARYAVGLEKARAGEQEFEGENSEANSKTASAHHAVPSCQTDQTQAGG